jgi:type IV pilus assembly protein PilE
MCPDGRGWRSTTVVAKPRGFTLVEVTIVVAMVAVLAAIALPSFQSSVRKARRADARSALVTTAQLMERYATEHAAAGYSTAILSTVPGSTVVAKPASENGYYILRLGNLGAATFTLSAVPQGGQTVDECATFTLDERGVRGLAGTSKSVAECW